MGLCLMVSKPAVFAASCAAFAFSIIDAKPRLALTGAVEDPTGASLLAEVPEGLLTVRLAELKGLACDEGRAVPRYGVDVGSRAGWGVLFFMVLVVPVRSVVLFGSTLAALLGRVADSSSALRLVAVPGFGGAVTSVGVGWLAFGWSVEG